MRITKLRNAWMILTCQHGSILSTIKRTRDESKAAWIELTGESWEQRKKMGDHCIKIAIYVERGSR
jgi:hypothetical protein